MRPSLLMIALSFSFSVSGQIEISKEPRSSWLSNFHWDKPENQISYAPYTTHYFRGDLAVSHLSSANYGWVEVGYFINSYRDATVALCYKTEVFEASRWTGHLIIGALYGYHKNLHHYPNIPFSSTILFSTEFTPIGGASIEYHFTEKLGLKATFVPLVGGVGLNYKL